MASFGCKLSVALKLRSDQWTSRYATIAGDVLAKLRRVSFPTRYGTGFCDECSRPIRFWDSRLFVADGTTAHRSCWESKQFFIEFVHQHSHEVTPALQSAVDLIESIVYSFYEAAQRGGENPRQIEYLRGALYGARLMLTELKGRSGEELALAEVCRRIGGPVPSTLPLAEDGNRYGWDGSGL